MPTSGQEFLSERFLFETRIVGFRDTLSRSKARRMIMILSAKLTKRWRATPQDSSSFFQAKNLGFVLNIVYSQYIYIQRCQWIILFLAIGGRDYITP